jgi:protein-disulfide isomerase
MLEAARLQDQFWPALEALFANQNRWVVNHRSNPARARAVLNSIPLDHARLDADINSPAVVAAVEHDVRDLQTLGVRATPEFFVNGQPLPSFGYRQLEQLVNEAVADEY